MTLPLWSTLRAIGNSSLVRLSALFPFVGYFILFNDEVTNFLQAHGLEQPSLRLGILDNLWSKKLYFLYFGLMFSGLGAMIYQWRCPPEVKKHADWKDYIAVEGETPSYTYLTQLAHQVGIKYIPSQDPKGSVGSDIMQRWYEKQDAMFSRARAVVAGLFAASAILLAIPSSLTAIKVLARILS
jgi:hypothetical protein